MNKFTLLILAVFTGHTSFSQEINIGLSSGGGLAKDNLGIFSSGVVLEYRPNKSIVSFNFEPAVLFYSKNNIYPVYPDYTVCTVPLYLKLIFGKKKVRLAPFAGGFITTTSSYGITAGLNVEYEVAKTVFLFLKNDFNQVYYKALVVSDSGQPQTVQKSSSLVWLSLGVKFNVFRLKSTAIRI